ncbi:MAG TPA: hypothetical protein ENJ55_00845, partial [Rhizobiales bacterium]|nr:hypothetical protein [Hyphomicrobiales bacterium]
MRSPNFIIAGERRCGTTTLANTLSRHSDIFVHPKPDGGYFIDDSVGKKASATGQAWASSHSLEDYQAWFLSAGAGSESALGEKSADYLFWHKSHPRMANFVPDAKLIVILRHPIDRAWSHYWNEVAKGRETLGFEEAIAAEAGRLEGSDYERYM